MFAARIHNNSLGKCIEIDDYNKGCQLIEIWAEEQGFILDEETLNNIKDTGEYYNDDDPENIYTFVIACFE